MSYEIPFQKLFKLLEDENIVENECLSKIKNIYEKNKEMLTSDFKKNLVKEKLKNLMISLNFKNTLNVKNYFDKLKLISLLNTKKSEISNISHNINFDLTKNKKININFENYNSINFPSDFKSNKFSATNNSFSSFQNETSEKLKVERKRNNSLNNRSVGDLFSRLYNEHNLLKLKKQIKIENFVKEEQKKNNQTKNNKVASVYDEMVTGDFLTRQNKFKEKLIIKKIELKTKEEEKSLIDYTFKPKLTNRSLSRNNSTNKLENKSPRLVFAKTSKINSFKSSSPLPKTKNEKLYPKGKEKLKYHNNISNHSTNSLVNPIVPSKNVDYIINNLYSDYKNKELRKKELFVNVQKEEGITFKPHLIKNNTYKIDKTFEERNFAIFSNSEVNGSSYSQSAKKEKINANDLSKIRSKIINKIYTGTFDYATIDNSFLKEIDHTPCKDVDLNVQEDNLLKNSSHEFSPVKINNKFDAEVSTNQIIDETPFELKDDSENVIEKNKIEQELILSPYEEDIEQPRNNLCLNKDNQNIFENKTENLIISNEIKTNSISAVFDRPFKSMTNFSKYRNFNSPLKISQSKEAKDKIEDKVYDSEEKSKTLVKNDNYKSNSLKEIFQRRQSMKNNSSHFI